MITQHKQWWEDKKKYIGVVVLVATTTVAELGQQQQPATNTHKILKKINGENIVMIWWPIDVCFPSYYILLPQLVGMQHVRGVSSSYISKQSLKCEKPSHVPERCRQMILGGLVFLIGNKYHRFLLAFNFSCDVINFFRTSFRSWWY